MILFCQITKITWGLAPAKTQPWWNIQICINVQIKTCDNPNPTFTIQWKRTLDWEPKALLWPWMCHHHGKAAELSVVHFLSVDGIIWPEQSFTNILIIVSFIFYKITKDSKDLSFMWVISKYKILKYFF
jgi:hypothetical protein